MSARTVAASVQVSPVRRRAAPRLLFMRCRVLLEGHSFDLDTLTQRFTSGEVMVKRDNDYCYLTGTQIDRAATPDDALRQATAQLPWINGIGRASDANYRRVGWLEAISTRTRRRVVVSSRRSELKGEAASQ